ncbi:uncharacterized protein F4807DRAFT_246726 [Annulohypoxylon truncatum]|uniref:uncharacterized protein n=1 Tax=Annulohypoxylon truncatum TaxID=327061 RepID=UPI002008CBD7|nr:uncharacterized protein F4807DRAFT_246726 [Annulohypoxylon truncatum]KAI1205918.1 hypothetical protein F4807DRAFT_246726 [Annulohypoxylon truncatum]
MASEVAGAATTAGAEPATFTLQIISPSIGIPQPFVVQGLPQDATVKQLKERIRNVVITRPPDEAQRLIHRGRLLGRDAETMIEVFGQEALRSSEPQSLHLVLRDLSDGRTTSTPNAPHQTTSNQPPTTGTHIPPQFHPHQNHHASPFQAQPHARIGLLNYPGFHLGPTATFQPVNPPAHLTPDQYSQWMRSLDEYTARLNQNRRPTMQGTQGAQGIPPTNLRGTPGTNTPGRTASPFQPDGTRTTVREGVGPNGLQWRVTYNETFVNPLQRPGRTGSPFPAPDTSVLSRPNPNGSQLSNNEVQSIFRSADAGSATRAMTDAMRRNASNSSLANLAASQAHHPIPPGVTTPLIASRAGSGTATPDPLRAAGRTRSPPTNQAQTLPSQGTPEVYILSSPTGPRALLFNNSGEAYYSPQVRTTYQPMGLPVGQRPLPIFPTHYNHLNPQYMIPTPTIQPPFPQAGRVNATNPQAGHSPQPPQPAQAQHGLPQPPQNQHQHLPQPQIGHAVARADNPQVQAIRIAQLWPHIWMIIRLGLFIWWFTSPTSGWSRWITVVSIAITLFLVNMGLLNPFADQFWVPVRRHLENLIPLADGHQRDAQAHGRGGNGDAAANAGQQGELDPADTAARLVQRRRDANANWLMDQVRRLERAGILFLASIAPGVAERHIAQMEAEARAERRRREAEAEAAATEERERQERSANAEQSAESSEPAASNNESGGHEQAAEGERDNERPPAAEEPLIRV